MLVTLERCKRHAQQQAAKSPSCVSTTLRECKTVRKGLTKARPLFQPPWCLSASQVSDAYRSAEYRQMTRAIAARGEGGIALDDGSGFGERESAEKRPGHTSANSKEPKRLGTNKYRASTGFGKDRVRQRIRIPEDRHSFWRQRKVWEEAAGCGRNVSKEGTDCQKRMKRGGKRGKKRRKTRGSSRRHY